MVRWPRLRESWSHTWTGCSCQSLPTPRTGPRSACSWADSAAARSSPYEQVNELQLAVEALLAHRTVAGESLMIEADLDATTVELTVGPFVPEDDPGGRRVLERLVRKAQMVLLDDGGEWVELATGERLENESGW